jgi:hypothetical protein
MKVFAAGIAGIRGSRFDPVELPFLVADRAMSVVAGRGEALPPELVETGGVVRILALELNDGHVGVGGFSVDRVVSVVCGHADSIHTLKG